MEWPKAADNIARQVARSYVRRIPWLEFDDAYQAAAMGLVQGLRRYTSSSQMALRARGAVVDYLRQAEYTRGTMKLHRAGLMPERVIAHEEIIDDDMLEDRLMLRDIRGVLSKYAKRLSKQQREAIRLYFDEDKTLEKAGQEMGVVDTRVCQIKQEGLRRLRQAIEDRGVCMGDML